METKTSEDLIELLEVVLLRATEQKQEIEFLRDEKQRLEQENRKLLDLVGSLSNLPNKEGTKDWMKSSQQ